MKKLLSCLCLILLAAPIGAGQWEGSATCKRLIEATNNKFSTLCKDSGLDRDSLLSQLKWIEQQQREDFREWYTVFNDSVKSISGTDDAACKKFINAFIRCVKGKLLEQNRQEQSVPTANLAKEKPAEKEEKTSQTKNSVNDSNVNDSENTPCDDSRNIDFFYLIGLFVILVLVIYLFVQDRKLNKKLRECYDNIGSIKEKISRIKRIDDEIGKIEKLEKDLQSLKAQMSSQKSAAHVMPAPPITTMPPAQKEHDIILYVTLDANNNSLFKQQTTRTPQHLYEIHLDNANATTGELCICSNIEPAFVQKFIDNRNSYFKICDVHSSVASPTRIVMKKPGQVVKRDNSWEVILGPQIELS